MEIEIAGLYDMIRVIDASLPNITNPRKREELLAERNCFILEINLLKLPKI